MLVNFGLHKKNILFTLSLDKVKFGRTHLGYAQSSHNLEVVPSRPYPMLYRQFSNTIKADFNSQSFQDLPLLIVRFFSTFAESVTSLLWSGAYYLFFASQGRQEGSSTAN
jgi:hypothetical protein